MGCVCGWPMCIRGDLTKLFSVSSGDGEPPRFQAKQGAWLCGRVQKYTGRSAHEVRFESAFDVDSETS